MFLKKPLDKPLFVWYIITMRATKENITFIPPVGDDGTSKPEHGWLNVNGKIHCITNIHSFADFGVEQDTLTLKDGREFVTMDGGETFSEQS